LQSALSSIEPIQDRPRQIEDFDDIIFQRKPRHVVACGLRVCANSTRRNIEANEIGQSLSTFEAGFNTLTSSANVYLLCHDNAAH
jgi:hypothetical protein